MKKRNLKFRMLVSIALALTIVTPVSGAIAEASTVKSKSNVNLRKAGSNSAAKVDYIYGGEVANYLGTVNGWFKLEIKGKIGYSHSSYWIGNTIKAKSNVNIRASANSTAKIVGYATTGKEAKILGRNGSWLFIDLNGVKGYSYKSYWDIPDTVFSSLPYVTSVGSVSITAPIETPVTSEAQVPIEAGDTYILKTSVSGHLNATDAKAGTNVVRTAEAGSYYVYSVSAEMLNISEEEGSPGIWINPESKTVATKPEIETPTKPEIETPTSPVILTTAEKVIKKATSLIGIPYVTGGDEWSDGGFDCSGFTQYCYRQAGIKVPRTAAQQWAGITRVKDPKPGDIIAFYRDGKVYHVGIFIGDNKMIHSPQLGKRIEIKELTWYKKNNLIRGYLRPTK